MAEKYNDVEDCARILLDAGAEIDAQDAQGNTPLHWALGAHSSKNWMEKGNPKAVAFLLDHKANAKLKNNQGLTSVALACRSAEAGYRKPFQE